MVLGDLIDQLLHPLFKLAPNPGALDQGDYVQTNDFLIRQLFWHFTRYDRRGEPFDDGSLPDPGFPD